MKLLSTSIAIAAVTAAALAEPEHSETAQSQCPERSSCYRDNIRPDCPPRRACPQFILVATACPWKCGTTPPQGCKTRCKPCKTKICPKICQCEIVCSSGPCLNNYVS